LIRPGKDSGHPNKIPAPRVSWKLHYGPIPDGKDVCHNCPTGDNPSCVNPKHLWLGTDSENIKDMYAKGRYPKRRPRER
jgi:hypothetical protein